MAEATIWSSGDDKITYDDATNTFAFYIDNTKTFSIYYDTESAIWFTSNANIRSNGHVNIHLDDNNNQTDRQFRIYAGSGTSELLLSIPQSSASALLNRSLEINGDAAVDKLQCSSLNMEAGNVIDLNDGGSTAKLDYDVTNSIIRVRIGGGRISLGESYLVLYPRSAPGSPAEGTVYYDSSAKKLKLFNGTSWETISSS
ncbi:MAG: hypothetical protein RBU45_21380 [Myxococcota bacterium]|jgi:hypothetical protein|nr:hypothetical protein [Myxococcota bacterium]